MFQSGLFVGAIMKKVLIIVLAVCLTFSLSGCYLEKISLMYDSTIEYEGFEISVNEMADCCFVGAYNCDNYTEGYEITIPDEYNNKPIKFIGGFFGRGVPTSFYIYVNNIINAPEGSNFHGIYFGSDENDEYLKNYEVVDMHFIINIGKNIEAVKYTTKDYYFPHINNDGSVTYYHPVVYINCSKENKYFYSKDGKLYSKKSNELVDEFSYAD